MPNEMQLQVLKEGVEVWNRWRKKRSEVQVDLISADLIDTDLIGANLRGAHLFGADLSRADLKGAHLFGADLGRVDLKGANLSGANLIDADLSNANLSDADLSRAELSDANLSDADLRGADLSDADLSDADLSRADLSRADLVGTHLIDTDLSGADLRGADLRGADLRGADLSYADLSDADLSDAHLIGAHLIGAHLIGAHLIDAHLIDAHLIDAHLIEAHLIDAILRGADLIDAHLTDAILRGADLRGADLRGADLIRADLTDADLTDAKLSGADLSVARLYSTHFANVDLRQVKGFEFVGHQGPSTIGTNTLELSRGQIPPAFLRGCGLSDWQIENTKLFNPDLDADERTTIWYEIERIRGQQPWALSRVFISYTRNEDEKGRSDEPFVEALENRFDKKGVRYWRDIHDLKAGRLERQIDRAITLNPLVLVVLSERSVESDWVEYEVAKARELEKQYRKKGSPRDVLCPVALDNAWKDCDWPRVLRRQIEDYNILDFSGWEDDERKFEQRFAKLYDGLVLHY